jgi:hypothetical protein
MEINGLSDLMPALFTAMIVATTLAFFSGIAFGIEIKVPGGIRVKTGAALPFLIRLLTKYGEHPMGKEWPDLTPKQVMNLSLLEGVIMMHGAELRKMLGSRFKYEPSGPAFHIAMERMRTNGWVRAFKAPIDGIDGKMVVHYSITAEGLNALDRAVVFYLAIHADRFGGSDVA